MAVGTAVDQQETTSGSGPAIRPFSTFERLVAWRYLRARRKEAFISVIAGFSFIGDGITVGTDGFTGGVPNLVAWAAFILFAVVATIAAWWRGRSDRPVEHQPVQDRFSRN